MDQIVPRVHDGLHLGRVLLNERAVCLNGESEREPRLAEALGGITFPGIGQHVVGKLACQLSESLLVDLRPSLLVVGRRRSDGPLESRIAHQVLEQMLDVLEEEQIPPDPAQHFVHVRFAFGFGLSGTFCHCFIPYLRWRSAATSMPS